MVYLFIGQDSLAKDIQLRRLKEEFLPKNLAEFNLDTLYAKELKLVQLQEKLLCLPAKAKKRIIIIREAQKLKEEAQGFLLEYLQKPSSHIILVLDIERYDKKDDFLKRIYRYVKVVRFQEAAQVTTFTLGDQIALKKADYALRTLNRLLKEGEKPERILGGLRYCWERDIARPLETKRRLNLLLNCDIEIKTGKLKAHFALEKLVVGLCGVAKPFH